TIQNGTLTAVISIHAGDGIRESTVPGAPACALPNVITLATGSVFDLAGNANSGATDSNNYAIDTIRPTVTISVDDTALNIGDDEIGRATCREKVSKSKNADRTNKKSKLTTDSTSERA